MNGEALEVYFLVCFADERRGVGGIFFVCFIDERRGVGGIFFCLFYR